MDHSKCRGSFCVCSASLANPFPQNFASPSRWGRLLAQLIRKENSAQDFVCRQVVFFTFKINIHVAIYNCKALVWYRNFSLFPFRTTAAKNATIKHAFGLSLGPTHPRCTTLVAEPFPSSAQKFLIFVNATSTKICTRDRSSYSHEHDL